MNSKLKTPTPANEELVALNDEQLDTVAGGAKKSASNPYAGYSDNLSEGLSPSTVRAVENIARECMAGGMDRAECGRYVQNQKHYELCCMNEAEGFDYMVDFYYINMVLDRIYGTSA